MMIFFFLNELLSLYIQESKLWKTTFCVCFNKQSGYKTVAKISYHIIRNDKTLKSSAPLTKMPWMCRFDDLITKHCSMLSLILDLLLTVQGIVGATNSTAWSLCWNSFLLIGFWQCGNVVLLGIIFLLAAVDSVLNVQVTWPGALENIFSLDLCDCMTDIKHMLL